MARGLRHVAAVLAVSVLATSCGGGDADSTTTTAEEVTTTAQPATTATTTAGGNDGLTAQEGDLVRVHYVGTLDDGSQFDSSRDRGATLDFTIGAGQMIAGFDQSVRGMGVGEIKTVRIEPADAYGEVNPDFFVTVDLSQVPEGVQVGDVLRDPSTGQPVEVIEVTEDSATIDVNHPLAGETLTFEIEMVEITR